MRILKKFINFNTIQHNYFLTFSYFVNKMRIIVRIAGIDWIKNIFFSTVMAQYTPAVKIHIKKKRDTLAFHIGSSIKNVQINPAARNPL